MTGQTVLRARQTHLRHIVDVPAGTTGAVQVLGRYLAPQDRRGVNGPGGFVAGEIEDRLFEHGTGKLTFPGGIGGDGVRHLDRFRCLGSTADTYAPGDEWLEVWEGPSPHGVLVAVVTPIGASISRTGGIELDCVDGLWLGNKMRETTAGQWHHAPRDVIEHYSGAWATGLVDAFPGTTLNTRWTVDAGTASVSTGKVQVVQPTAATPSVPFPSASITASTGLTTASNRWTIEATMIGLGPSAADGSLVPAMPDTTGGDSGTAGIVLAGGIRLNNTTTLAINVGTGQLIFKCNGLEAIIRKRVTFPANLTIESSDRWAYGYVNGEAIGVFSAPAAPSTVSFYVAGDTIASTSVDNVLVRQHRPFLMRGTDKGDYRLPGAPPPGGLAGEYFDDASLNGDLTQVLSPVSQPYARRLDALISFPAAGTQGWQPGGPPNNQRFSARWTGAIFLNLAAADLRLQAVVDGACRVWVGRTRFGEQIIDSWSDPVGERTLEGPYLRTTLGLTAGWFPIVIEYAQVSGGSGIYVNLVGSNGYNGRLGAVSETSPLGIYQDVVRHDSFGDALKNVANIFGYQYRLEPKALESGLFPGQLSPRVRVGRDTNHQITDAEAVDVTVKLSGEEVAHTMLIDGAGLSDPGGSTQLTTEAIDYTAITEHLIVHQGSENLADLQVPGLLEQRANSLLTLLSSPWEEVSARDLKDGTQADAFPLTGDLAALQVGDGIRLDLPSVGVQDFSPRQILGRTRAFTPDGMSVPVARFRQRPRSLRETVRKILKTAVAPQRNYQGSLTLAQGTIGSTNAGTAPDGYSRIVLPANSATIVSADLVVHYKQDASSKTIEVNTVATSIAVTSVGRYDVTAFIGRAGPGQVAVARLTGGTGAHDLSLEITVRI